MYVSLFPVLLQISVDLPVISWVLILRLSYPGQLSSSKDSFITFLISIKPSDTILSWYLPKMPDKKDLSAEYKLPTDFVFYFSFPASNTLLNDVLNYI